MTGNVHADTIFTFTNHVIFSYKYVIVTTPDVKHIKANIKDESHWCLRVASLCSSEESLKFCFNGSNSNELVCLNHPPQSWAATCEVWNLLACAADFQVLKLVWNMSLKVWWLWIWQTLCGATCVTEEAKPRCCRVAVSSPQKPKIHIKCTVVHLYAVKCVFSYCWLLL